MRKVWVGLALALSLFCFLGFNLNSRSAAIVGDGSGGDTIYFLSATTGDTLEYVNGFSVWSTAAFGLQAVAWPLDTVPSFEDTVTVPSTGVTVAGATAFIVLHDQTAAVYGYGWLD